MSIDMMTPAEAALHEGEIAKRWRSYRTIAIKEKQKVLGITEGRLYKLLSYYYLSGQFCFGRFLLYIGILSIFTQLQHKGCTFVKIANLLYINSKTDSN